MTQKISLKTTTSRYLFCVHNLKAYKGETFYCTDTHKCYLYNGNGFVELNVPSQDYKVKEDKILQPYMCKCCGAPMHISICEYCGVEYR